MDLMCNNNNIITVFQTYESNTDGEFKIQSEFKCIAYSGFGIP